MIEWELIIHQLREIGNLVFKNCILPCTFTKQISKNKPKNKCKWLRYSGKTIQNVPKPD